jgi:hypothetical protein
VSFVRYPPLLMLTELATCFCAMICYLIMTNSLLLCKALLEQSAVNMGKVLRLLDGRSFAAEVALTKALPARGGGGAGLLALNSPALIESSISTQCPVTVWPRSI